MFFSALNETSHIPAHRVIFARSLLITLAASKGFSTILNITSKQDCLAIDLGQVIFCWKEQKIPLNGPLALDKLFLIDNRGGGGGGVIQIFVCQVLCLFF